MDKLRTDRLVLGTVNASLRREIDADTLAALLRSASTTTHLPWLAVFFSEVSATLVMEFAVHHGIGHEELGLAYQKVREATQETNRALELCLFTEPR